MAYLLGTFIGGLIFYLVPAGIVWRKDKDTSNALLFIGLIVNIIYPFVLNEPRFSAIYIFIWIFLGAFAIATPKAVISNSKEKHSNMEAGND